MKRFSCFILAFAFLLLAALPAALPAHAAKGGYAYDPAAAVQHAKDHENGYTKNQCASYASALLRAGGLKDVRESIVGNLVKYLVENKYAVADKLLSADEAKEKLRPGDLLVVRCRDCSYYGYHVIFVSGVYKKGFRYYARNNKRTNQYMSYSSLMSYKNYWEYGHTANGKKHTAKVMVMIKMCATVEYNANGGTGGPTLQRLRRDETISMETPERRGGYTFLGWSAQKKSATAEFQPGSAYSGHSQKLYAVWEQTCSTEHAWRADGVCGACGVKYVWTSVPVEESAFYRIRSALIERKEPFDGAQQSAALAAGTYVCATGRVESDGVVTQPYFQLEDGGYVPASAVQLAWKETPFRNGSRQLQTAAKNVPLYLAPFDDAEIRTKLRGRGTALYAAAEVQLPETVEKLQDRQKQQSWLALTGDYSGCYVRTDDVEFAGGAMVSSKIEISGVSAPENGAKYEAGTPITLRGKISSAAKLTDVTATLYLVKSGRIMQTYSFVPEGKTADLYRSLNAQMDFSRLSAERYGFQVEATDALGYQTRLIERTFTVVSGSGTVQKPAEPAAPAETQQPRSIPAPEEAAPEPPAEAPTPAPQTTERKISLRSATIPNGSVLQGAAFPYKGTVTATFEIASLIVRIEDAEGNILFEETRSMNGTGPFDLGAWLRESTPTEALEIGSYVFLLRYVDAEGREREFVERSFTIE